MKLKLRLLYKLSLIVLLFSYGVMIAAGIFPGLKLFHSPHRAKIKRDALKTHWLKRFGAIVNLRITREGELPARTALIVSNHISWLDILVLGQYLPAYFVAKNDIAGWPVIGFLARQGGTIFIRRGDKQQIRETSEQMLGLLQQNSHIIAFPEGTTTLGDEIRPFHSSLFQPALSARSMIQPVAIEYTGAARVQAPFVGEETFIAHLIRMLTMDKLEVRVSFLSAFDYSDADRQTVSRKTRAMISERILNDLPDQHQYPVDITVLPSQPAVAGQCTV